MHDEVVPIASKPPASSLANRTNLSSYSSKHDTNQTSSTKPIDEYKETRASPKSKNDDHQSAAHASSGT
ncbi:unnamed protein product [Rotaria sp. Silwood1]|nr:unnamed protein product [Rotaria sp. Silwood1]